MYYAKRASLQGMDTGRFLGHVVKTRLGRSNCVVGRLGGYSCGNNGQWAGDMTDDVNSLFGIVMTY